MCTFTSLQHVESKTMFFKVIVSYQAEMIVFPAISLKCIVLPFYRLWNLTTEFFRQQSEK